MAGQLDFILTVNTSAAITGLRQVTQVQTELLDQSFAFREQYRNRGPREARRSGNAAVLESPPG